MDEYSPYEMVHTCPYDPSHSFQAKHLWRHVVKCRGAWFKRCQDRAAIPWTNTCQHCGLEYWGMEATYHYKQCSYYPHYRCPPVPVTSTPTTPRGGGGNSPDGGGKGSQPPKEVPVGILVEF